MQTYICKCGRKFQKSGDSDTTGYRLQDYGQDNECFGCPYIVEIKEWYPKPTVKGHECRGSKYIEYGSTARLSIGDKCVGKIYSLDFEFLRRVKEYADRLEGITPDRAEFSSRPADYGNDGRHIFTVYPLQNKTGIRAKQLLQQAFFNEDGSRKDKTPEEERQIVINRIKEGKSMGKLNVGNITAGLDKVKSVAESLANVSDFKLIPLEYIRPAQYNPFADHDTDQSRQEVAASIQANGLLEPLVVNKKSDEEYTLISGEHRFTAIKQYLAERFKIVPCMVFENQSDDAAQLKLYEANRQREYTQEEKFKRYQDLEALFNRRKESGDYHGPIQLGIASLLGVSDRQIRKYKAITENLPAEAQEAILQGELSINDAARMVTQTKNPEEPPEEPKTGTGSGFSESSSDEPPLENDTPSPDQPPENATNPQHLTKVKIQYALKQHYQQKKDKLFIFYLFQVPTTQEAIPELKPDCGYSGGSVIFEDGTHGDCTAWSTRLEISYQRIREMLTYSQVDSVIREMIRSGEWLPEDQQKKLILKHIKDAKENQTNGNQD